MRRLPPGRRLRRLLLALGVLTPAPAQPSGPVVPDVPFLAQSAALCGGASLAMVLRYWGLPGIQPEDFSGSLDSDGKGIRAGVMPSLAERYGFQAIAFESGERVAIEHLQRGRPLIALLADPRGRYHYVVMLAWEKGRVLFHDPAFGPSRALPEGEWRRRWRVSHDWALLLVPRPAPTPASLPEPEERLSMTPESGDLARARAEASSAFRRENWAAAAGGARRVLAIDPEDALVRRLLATSLFLDGRGVEALGEWNRVGEPRLDRIALEGLSRTSTLVALQSLSTAHGGLLTGALLARVERRVAALPAVQMSRVTYRPLPDGMARIEASVVERSAVSRPLFVLTGSAVRGLSERAASASAYVLTPSGERVSADGHWHRSRSRAALAVSSPRLLSLPGISTVEVFREVQSYRVESDGTAPTVVREVRTRAALSLDRWWTGDTRVRIGIAADRWEGRGRWASLAGEVEQRGLSDRVAVLARVAGWWSAGEAPLHEVVLALMARSGTAENRLRLTARTSWSATSATAPRALWPGAGTGTGREGSLRARPILRDGIVDSEAFGPRLWNATVEIDGPLGVLGPSRLSGVAFIDAAGVPGRERSTGLVDVGLGVRWRFAGSSRALQLVVATPWSDLRPRISLSWQRVWP